MFDKFINDLKKLLKKIVLFIIMGKVLKEIPFDKKREYEWLVISQSYFQCALMNARVLKEELSNFAISVNSPLDFCLKKIYGDYPQNCEYLVFPIILLIQNRME